MQKKMTTMMLVGILLVNFAVILTMAQPALEPHNADAMWVEPSSVTFTGSNGTVGQKFNVTVWLNVSSANVFGYQVSMLYNRSQLACLRGDFTGAGKSDFMTGHSTQTAGPLIDTQSTLGNGSVQAFESCKGSDNVVVPRVGSLIWIEFQVVAVPPNGETYTSKFDITSTSPSDNWVKDEFLSDIAVTTYDATYQFTASPPLSVSISPPSATISVNQSLLFTSNVSGGSPPYSFQWFMNFSSVPGATSNSWVFATPSAGSTVIYLEVTDNDGKTVQSNNAFVAILPTPPVGADVALVPNANGLSWNGGSLPTTGFPGGFSPTFTDLDPATIRDSVSDPIVAGGFKIVVLVQINFIQNWLVNPTFKSRIENFVFNGGKLIIWDSECQQNDYSQFIYPFSENTPGAQGSYFGTVWIVENNTLGTNDTTSVSYVNTAAISGGYDIGDANVIVTNVSDWCTHLVAKNLNIVVGPVQAYADYGKGLIIWNGLDMDYMGGMIANDNFGDHNLNYIWYLQLLQPWNPDNLPCTTRTSGITVTPINSTNPTGTTHTVTATVRDNLANPIPNYAVHLNIYAGPNAGLSGTNVTNSNGEAYFSWTSFLAGTDRINGTAQCPFKPTVTIFDDKASKTWIQVKFTLTVCVRSTSTNQSLSGATVVALGPENRSGITDGGTVVFNSTQAGNYTVTASKPGYTSASMSLSLTNDTQITLRLTPMTRELKKEAIAELEDAKGFTNDKHIIRKIDAAIGEINESLNPSLWVDDFHLDPKHGHKVFQEEKNAVGNLMYILKDKKTGSAVKNITQAVIGKLLRVDQLLADAAIKDAIALNSTDCRVIHEIKEADEEFSEALRKITKGDYGNAVEEFKHAWIRAQHAMKKEFGDVDCDGKCDGKDTTIGAFSFASYGPDYTYPGSRASPRWNANCDVNNDGKVDGEDLSLIVRNFGKVYN